VQLSDQRLIYQPSAAAGSNVQFNTLTTPRGGQYELVLPDGTKAWLNAASSITYPVCFNGGRREIKVTGEVYFEVASDPHKPFYITVRDGVSMEVLGTHFNINAYGDEDAINTTLLEGRLRVVRSGSEVILKPGQQARAVVLKQGEQTQAGSNEGLVVADDVDVALVMAWKNGLFRFHEADLPTVLRQVARWYDVDIQYEGGVPVRTFEGKIERNLSLQQVLKILTKNDVQLSLEGRSILVKK
jgi:ferric-dicitrate binding protein FerR (iron transport regulator)